MTKKVRISKYQLSLLIISFIFHAISGLGAKAKQDAWLALILAWAGGFILLAIYLYISILNPEKTLIEILKDIFGKYLGSFLAILYLWYFIHLASIVLSHLGDFTVNELYPQTPKLFIIISIVLPIIYILRNGLEVISRTNEIFGPITIFIIILLFFIMFPLYDLNNLKPFLAKGIKPVIRSSFSLLAFPFGEIVLFLMIFPYLNNKKVLFKTSFLSYFFIGFFLFIIIISNLMILGPDMYSRYLFPNIISTRINPLINLTPLVVLTVLVGGGVKIVICAYATITGICQLFNLQSYKLFVIPVSIIIISLSIWLYDNVIKLVYWDVEIYPYYAIPFQIIIPIMILMGSLIKKYVKSF